MLVVKTFLLAVVVWVAQVSAFVPIAPMASMTRAVVTSPPTNIGGDDTSLSAGFQFENECDFPVEFRMGQAGPLYWGVARSRHHYRKNRIGSVYFTLKAQVVADGKEITKDWQVWAPIVGAVVVTVIAFAAVVALPYFAHSAAISLSAVPLVLAVYTLMALSVVASFSIIYGVYLAAVYDTKKNRIESANDAKKAIESGEVDVAKLFSNVRVLLESGEETRGPFIDQLWREQNENVRVMAAFFEAGWNMEPLKVEKNGKLIDAASDDGQKCIESIFSDKKKNVARLYGKHSGFGKSKVVKYRLWGGPRIDKRTVGGEKVAVITGSGLHMEKKK